MANRNEVLRNAVYQGGTNYERNLRVQNVTNDLGRVSDNGENSFSKYDEHIANGGTKESFLGGFKDQRTRDNYAKMLEARENYVGQLTENGMDEQEARKLTSDTYGNITESVFSNIQDGFNGELDAKVKSLKLKKDDAVRAQKAQAAARQRDVNIRNATSAALTARAQADAAKKAADERKIQIEAEKRAKQQAEAQKNAPESMTSKLSRLAYDAQNGGYKNITAESMQKRFEQAKAKALSDYESGVKAGRIDPHTQAPTDEDVLASMRSNLETNMKKRPSRLAEAKAREAEKAKVQAGVTNENRAMVRGAARTLGGNTGSGSGMSFAQAEAKARWAAKDNADRYGRRNNIGAAMDAYVGSSRHGFDTVANLGGNGRPVNLSLPKGSAADNYVRAYEFNQGFMKAQQDMQQAKIQQERNLAQQATTLANVTPPNASAEVKANNVAAMGKAGASPTQPQPIRGY